MGKKNTKKILKKESRTAAQKNLRTAVLNPQTRRGQYDN